MPFLELDVLQGQPDEPEGVLGIDLGTTNSLVAIWKDGRPTILRPDPERDDARIPSALFFDGPGQVVVGREARARAADEPEKAIFSVKRFMGRGLSDVTDDASSMSFRVSQDEKEQLYFDVFGMPMSPQELSALILREVHAAATRALGSEAPRRAVITVPAYFDDAQRQATRDAARIAGLDVLRIVNEPTAASLAYGLDQKNDGTVCVFDLGGGTFDVTLLNIDEGVFRVLSTAGDTHLGGDDLDRTLVRLALEEIDAPEAVKQDAGFLTGLRLAAESTKLELSTKPEADLHVVSPAHGVAWRRTITREEFVARIQPYLDRTLAACRQALDDAKLSIDAIDEVVLVGGSTRIPAVRAAVEAFFGRPPHTELNPDEVVALGAAIQGHVLAGGTRDVLLLDVTPLSLGLEVMGGAADKIIARNAPIPSQATQGFTTHVDNQTGIQFHVVQGEREMAADCRTLGRFELTGLPPMPAGMPRVAVRFAIDADGILTVTAKEESTGTNASIEVRPMHGLDDEEVEAMLEASYANAQADFDASRAANLRVELGTMLSAIEKNLPHVAPRLDVESLEDLEEAVRAARDVRTDDAAPVATLQTVRDGLEQAALPLAAELMDAVAKQALAGKALGEV
ncbi:MAG: Fe-S protein assembly chaperone HscA [Planctomycetota bacterium]